MNGEAQIVYYQEHPPRNLAGFVVQPVELADFTFDGHGLSGSYPDGLIESLNIVFKVNCTCGSPAHLIIAESVGNEVYFHDGFVSADRFHLKCSSCSKQSLLFDPSLHGYNAEIFLLEDTLEETTAQVGSQDKIHIENCYCQGCENEIFEVFVRFEYSTDLFEDTAFNHRAQEFYSWFTTVAKCSKCARLNRHVEYECA